MTPAFSTVCFDVDSTLVTIEGIDVLASGDDEVIRLTEAAMNGEIPIDEVYGRRLEIVRPDLEALQALGSRYVSSLVPGARDLIERLQGDRVAVRLVTAGIEQAILPLAEHLRIPRSFVHAVPVELRPDGGYVGYDRSAPTSRPGGKAIVIRNIRSRNKGRIAFIGDGVTDLETATLVDRFVGFGGVVQREQVRRDAPLFVTSFSELAPLLYEDNDD